MICKRIRQMSAANPEGGPDIKYEIGSLVSAEDVGAEVVMMLCTHPKRYAIPHDDECRQALATVIESPAWKRRLQGLQEMEKSENFESLTEAEQQRVIAFVDGGYIKSTHAASKASTPVAPTSGDKTGGKPSVKKGEDK